MADLRLRKLRDHGYGKTQAKKAKAMATLDRDGDSSSCSWSLATNWTIAGGSLDTAVTFESFDSPIDSETVDADVKPPLVLKPSSRDCGPCEIKISFTHEHEVRQVYVRSTARVYEIYFAPSMCSGNEYLCTVRCGVAARDDEVLHATGSEEPAGAHSKGSAGELAKEKRSDDGNNASSEEDWIEVKAPDSLLQNNKHDSVPEKNDDNPRTSIQEFYEATAEITDADACISLTLRLLSLQNKGCLYVDEIYVFADPVESADSETQASQMGNLAGSSLMGMLVPTLLQLSKTGNNQRLDKHAAESPDTLEKGEQLEVGSRVSYSSIIPNEIEHDESVAAQHDVKLQKGNEAKPEISQFQIPAQVSNTELGHSGIKPDVPYDRIERALEQLVSRVSKIEDICLRFEENMLKPISSIEARLQQVEQQVEKLNKNSQYFGLPSCSRISAPPFSCNGSNSSFFNNDGSDYPACGVLGLEKKDIPCSKLSNPPDDISFSVNGPRFLPSLVVTAPEFSNEESSDIVEPAEDGPQEKMKQALSIDDVLAAALAGFLSTTGVQPSHYTQTLSVKAPEFSVDEIGDDDEVLSTTAQSDKPIVPLISSRGSNGTECTCNSVSTPRSTSLVLDMGNFGDECFKETPGGADGQDQLDVGSGSCRSLGNSVNFTTTKAEVGLAQTDDCQNAEPTHTAEASDEISVSVSETTDVPKQLVRIQTEDTSDAPHEGDAASAKDVTEGTEEDILQKDFQSSSASCVVDFELPILDVKFSSSETPTAKSPLEALLTTMHEFGVDTPRVQQRNDGEVICEQSNLILAEDGEPKCDLTGHSLLVDWDDYDCGDATSSVEVVACQDSCTGKNPEMSLI